MSEPDKNEADSKEVYKYTISLEGIGGDFACIPLTEEQARYWGEQGDLALAAHISLRGDEDKDVPTEFHLPDFRDEDWITGVDPGATLRVEDEDGDCCLELSPDDEEFQEKLNFSRELGPFDGPPSQPVAMYRTVLKGADVYEVTTKEPFDPARLSFDCVEVSRWGDVIQSIKYEGGEVEFIDGVDREKQDPLALLIQK